MRNFLPDSVDKVYDPTCGDGALLDVFDDDVIKYGQDINEEQVKNAQSKIKNFNGYVGDTLKDPYFSEIKFDYIIANPPFSIKWEPEYDSRFDKLKVLAPKSKADWAFMLHILHYLSDDGIAVVMNFPGVLYRGNAEYVIRKWFVDNNFIEKIVHIPGDKFVDTKISTCLIVLNKRKVNTDVLFINDEIKKDRLVKLEEIVKNDYNLSVTSYVYKEVARVAHDPIELQKNAREAFKKTIEHELEFDKMVCDFEGLSFQDYIEDIEEILNKYKG